MKGQVFAKSVYSALGDTNRRVIPSVPLNLAETQVWTVKEHDSVTLSVMFEVSEDPCEVRRDGAVVLPNLDRVEHLGGRSREFSEPGGPYPACEEK